MPFGILLVEEAGGPPAMRLRDLSCFDELDEEQLDILESLPQDLAA